MLFWISSHGAPSAFVSLTMYYPQAPRRQTKQFYTILKSDGKWHHLTADPSRICFAIYDYNTVKTFAKPGTSILLLVMHSKHKLKTKYIQQSEDIFRAMQVPTLPVLSFFSHVCGIQNNQIQSVWWYCYPANIVYIMHLAVIVNAYNHTVWYKHMCSDCHTLRSHISYHQASVGCLMQMQ